MQTHLTHFVVFFSLVGLGMSRPRASEANSPPLPILKLPYASYRASSYNADEDLYIFSNIRYAAPPVGDLRWAKPAPPLKNSTLQDGSLGHACVQTAVKNLNVLGPGNKFPLGTAIDQFVSGIPVPLFNSGNEDCLFLDVSVPGKALRSPSTSKLPVVVWLYGGAYVFGSKDSALPGFPFYDGSGLINQSGGEIIFVAMNYRLGAYGFLAGTTMEREALPNAGLWDQRAAFQWVHDHISLLGGDPTQVIAMGESAGAGSLMHHLVAGGGTLDPLFKRAILQSPAYQWMYDRAGTVEATFQAFAKLAGCAQRGNASSTSGETETIQCLRSAHPDALQKANKALMDTVPAGSFAVGPTTDGSFIRQLPVLELTSGNYAKGVEAFLLSHCAEEATLFVTGRDSTDALFADFLRGTFPNYTHSNVVEKILEFYPPVDNTTGTPVYSSESARYEAFLRDSCFTCNVRHLNEGVGDNKVWNMQYSVTPGWHGTDLLPMFFNARAGVNLSSDVLKDILDLLMPAAGILLFGLSTALQSYFASFVTAGNPNAHRVVDNFPSTIQWDHPVSNSSGEQIMGVLNMGDFRFSTINDTQNEKTPCQFWRNVAAAVTNLGGYAPPGAVVEQTLVKADNDPSANYVGGNRP
ncbi:hypothetical protein SPBR_06820 [Sporothrix brasiliensis 5110]|uniref:Carboxylesterase type B domain-containing protein n=1 Tax=Sporothrix brasiliensis 5110 TaxID=1398154 RepID=A0A0C2EPN8_9PEZI|nr:uncharacterized protein SPBR_06820 [Sporothrix brasiliensis 5110]KIH88214.1 hypothetical protein SPBR_06820 [Sporothrix brasiliensis 5110]